MKSKKIIPLIILAVTATCAILYFEVFHTIDLNPSEIKGSGTIEVTEVDIASKIAGRVLEIPFEEGNNVSAQQTLVSLSFDELAPQKAAALANLANAEKNYQRTQVLYQSGSVSKQNFDNMLTAYTNARSQYESVMVNISNAVITSPLDGTVLKKNLERGELTFPGTPIMVIADLKKPWIRIYVSEKKIGRLKLGQKADIAIDTFPDRKYPGIVSAISNKAEFTPKTIQTKEERVKLVYAVKISLENRNMDLKPGMPADAVIYAE